MPGVRRRIEFEEGIESGGGRTSNRRREESHLSALEEEVCQLTELIRVLNCQILRERISVLEGMRKLMEDWRAEADSLAEEVEVESSGVTSRMKEYTSGGKPESRE